MTWALRMGAECHACPLRDCDPIPSEPATRPGERIYVVGDFPGAAEERRMRPFVGGDGGLLNSLLDDNGLPRELVTLSNAIACRVPFQMGPREQTVAARCCAPRLHAELSEVGPGSLILAFGAQAIKALTGKNSVKAWRGYPLPALDERLKDALVFPTYHPGFIRRTPHYLPVWRNDVARALAFYRGRLKPWVWPPLVIHEGAEMYEALCAIGREPWVGVDVETAGEDAYSAKLLCIGLASEDIAVSVAWPALDPEIHDMVKHILASPTIRKVYQNGSYDQISLDANRIQHSGNDFDTLLAHRILYPALAHDLGFIASQFFAASRWKSEFRISDDRKGSSVWAEAAKDQTRFEALRRYNAQDSLMTARLRPAMEKELNR